MSMRLAALLPRAVILALIWVLGTAAFTFAADSTIVGPPHPSSPAAAAKPAELVVPSVTGQAYVFAKGILEDAGFAWHVSGSVHGYSSNRVLTQSPVAGTRVLDTGAPTIVLRLVRGPYAQLGRPADSAPAAPAKKPAAKPAVKSKAKPKRKHSSKHKPKVAARPPAFVSPGAPKEPLDEMALPARALRLEAWLANRPRSSANVSHWLYQHAWIVTGAKFGWWHGEQALQILIRVDRRLQQRWGIGGKSEAVARAALAKVRSRTR
jgi:hypothetical protein